MPSDMPANAVAQNDPIGDEICSHHIRNVYGFDPKEGDMGKDFDWTYNPTPRNDPGFTDEWTWCAISRTQFWNKLVDAYWKTHNEKYAAEWVSQMMDFSAKNPVDQAWVKGKVSLWRTLDASERMHDSWPYAYYHCLNSPSFTPEAQRIYLKMMPDHALLLVNGLKNPDRTGNWVAFECFGLYTIGALFPELQSAAAWRQVATDRITRELERMVPPDGFEAELTPNYHMVALDGFLGPLKLAQLNKLTVPDVFKSKILSIYRALVVVMDQSGNDVGTNDSGDYNAARTAREGLKLGYDPLLDWAASGRTTGKGLPDSTMLPYAGFYAMRGGWKPDDLFLFFRAGPTGIGHEHEDMLEIVLRAWNKTLLFDPGSYLYDHSDWRRFTIGTASHNTIIVDGKWQHRGASKAPVEKKVEGPWVTTPLFDYVAGTYNGGYQQSVYDQQKQYQPQDWVGDVDKSVTHTRRVLFLRPYYALVLDTLDGAGMHTFDAHFHLDSPSAHVDPAAQAAFSENQDVQLALYPLDRDHLAVDIIKGQKEPLLGWWPSQHRPIPTVRFRKQQVAPALFATFLYPYKGADPAFEARPLKIEGTGVWSQALTTAAEKAEIAIVKSGAASLFSCESALLGSVRIEAAGFVARQRTGSSDVVAGSWELISYGDARTQLSMDAPSVLLISRKGDHPLLLNGGEKPVKVSFTRPFTLTVDLPPGVWTELGEDGAHPGTAPTLP